MNPTLEVIAQRKSLRAYSDQPVTQEEKDAILWAAFRAPTAGNLMLYSIIEVEDQAIKDRLAVTCDHQPFIARAPFVLIFLADYQRWTDIFTYSDVDQCLQELGRVRRTPQEGDLMLACCDALIAAQNAAIAAESLGIGSCYIGDIFENYEIHRDLLNLPQYVFPISMLCFGHPTEDYATRKQATRFEREFIVHKDAYRRLDPEQLQRMLQPLEERFLAHPLAGARNVGQATYLRKFDSDYSLEMNRSTREMLRRWSQE